jgi:glycosyltransferase involved in cell wall biosynthesis
MKQNKFIVVVPVYNADKFIEKCMFSILDQDYENFDIIVIDDCSSDNTAKILRRLNKEYEFDLIVNKERLRSPLENFIKGIEVRSTDPEDIIVTVDGDDWLVDDKVLSYLNEVYQDENIWMSYGQYEPLSKTYSHYCKPIPDTRTYRRSGAWLTSALRTVKRKLFDKINRDDLKDETGGYYKAAGDLAYMFPIIEMAGPKHIKFIDKVLYIYNDVYPGNEMKTDRDRQLARAAEMRQKPLYDELDKI